jgi:AcrR family transcriptional regulator
MGDVTLAAADAAAPRKRDAEATRTAMLNAAKLHFAQSGYDRALLRDIAADAGADVSLIKRYFGGKEGLFEAALKASFGADRLAGWNRASFGRDMAVMMAGDPHQHPERTQSFQFLLRAATSPTTAPMLNAAVQERFMEPIRDWLGGEDVEARARLLAATFIGFLVERLIRNQPLEGREREVFIARATAVFEGLVSQA